MASLNKDTFYSLLIKVPVLALNFLSGIILARMLGGVGRGVYQYMTTGTDLAILILGLNLPTALAYFIASNTVDRKKVLGITFTITMGAIGLFGLFLVSMFFFSGNTLAWFLPKEYQNLFFVAFLFSYFVLLLLQNVLMGILQGDRQFNTINLLSVVLRVIPVIVYGSAYFLLFYSYLDLNLQERFGLVVFVQVVSLIVYLGIALPKIKPQLSFSFKGYIRPFLDYLSIIYIDMLVFFLNKRSNIWFIEEYNDMASLGDYAMALLLSESIGQLLAVVPMVLLPYLTRMNKQDGIQTFLLFHRISFWSVIILCGIVALLAPFIIWICLGNEFIGATRPLQILSIAIIFITVRNMFASYNFACKRPARNLYGDLLGLVTILGLGYWLIPQYGIVGASFAALGTYFVSSCYFVLDGLFYMRASVWDLFVIRWADVGKIKEKFF